MEYTVLGVKNRMELRRKNLPRHYIEAEEHGLGDFDISWQIDEEDGMLYIEDSAIDVGVSIKSLVISELAPYLFEEE